MEAFRLFLPVHRRNRLPGDRGPAARLLQRVLQPHRVRVRLQGFQERLRQGRGRFEGGQEDRAQAAREKHEGRHDPVHHGRELAQLRHQAEAPGWFRRLLQKLVGCKSLNSRGLFNGFLIKLF